MARRRGTYKRRRTYPRRSYKRSSRYGKRRTSRRYGRVATRQAKVGFSRSQVVKMRYCQQVTLNPNTDSGNYIIFSANNPYAPNAAAGTGVSYSLNHQPYSWDQWANVYNDYVVIGSKIGVTAVAPNSTNPASGAGLISLFLSDSITPYSVTTTSGITTAIESGRCTFRQFSPNTSQAPVKLSKTFSAKKFWNVTNIKDNVTRIGAATNSSPAEQAYFHLYFHANDESITTTAGPYCWVYIDYLMVLSGPADLSAS